MPWAVIETQTALDQSKLVVHYPVGNLEYMSALVKGMVNVRSICGYLMLRNWNSVQKLFLIFIIYDQNDCKDAQIDRIWFRGKQFRDCQLFYRFYSE